MKVRPRRDGSQMVGLALTRATPGQNALVRLDSGTADADPMDVWMEVEELVQPGMLVERVDWWEDRDELAAVMAMLHDADAFAGVRDAVYYVEKPWKWTPARERWCEYGRPVHGEDQWDPFVEEIRRDD